MTTLQYYCILGLNNDVDSDDHVALNLSLKWRFRISSHAINIQEANSKRNLIKNHITMQIIYFRLFRIFIP